MQDEHQSENQPAEKPAPLGWRAFVLVGFMALVAVALITVGWRIWFSVDTEMDPFAWWLIGGALLIFRGAWRGFNVPAQPFQPGTMTTRSTTLTTSRNGTGASSQGPALRTV